MNPWVSFLIGILVGGLLGTFIVALLVVGGGFGASDEDQTSPGQETPEQ